MDALLELLAFVLPYAFAVLWLVALVHGIVNRQVAWGIGLVLFPPVALVYLFFMPRITRAAREQREQLRMGRRRLQDRVERLERQIAGRDEQGAAS